MQNSEKTKDGKNTTKEDGPVNNPNVTIEDAVVELEEYAKAGKVPPKGKRYLIRIDKVKFEVSVSAMSGRELLDLSGKKPPENFLLTQKLHGGASKKIGLQDTVDFTTPGIERFMTLPLDQQEG